MNHRKKEPATEIEFLPFDTMVEVERPYPIRSNYSFVADDPNKPLIIIDNGPWDKFMSVTNDAEFVVLELRNKLLEGRRLFYYDSENEFCELLIRDGRFAGFGHAIPSQATEVKK